MDEEENACGWQAVIPLPALGVAVGGALGVGVGGALGVAVGGALGVAVGGALGVAAGGGGASGWPRRCGFSQDRAKQAAAKGLPSG